MQGFCLDVTGCLASFNRAESKVERHSYPIITPSAARAVFESILWKPSLLWKIERIEVLKPIRWISIRRNEVGAKISTRNVQTAMKNGHGQLGLCIEDERQQRAGLLLRDVRYRLHARFELTSKAGPGENPAKFAEMFRRRAQRGQCVNQPYLGCREFAADFRLVEHPENETPPVDITEDLGLMLLDFDYSRRDSPEPRYFEARLRNGVLIVPAWDSAEVRS